MELPQLIERLADPAAYSYPVKDVEVHQTHISAVFLAGPFAYKIKKPVNPGFLDFSTLDKRRHFCDEEVRLNRRLAPEVYLGVVPVVQSPAGGVKVEGDGEVVEWAVKMQRLQENATFLERLRRGEITAAHVEALAHKVAAFHQEAKASERIAAFGRFDAVARIILDVYDLARPQVGTTVNRAVFDRLRALAETTLARLRPLAEQNPKEPFAEEALIWILTNEYQLLRFRPWYEHTARYEMIRVMTSGGRRWGVPTKQEQYIRRKATDLLLRDHVSSAKLARVAEMLGSSQDKKSAMLLRAILDKNPNKEVKAEAFMALARQMQARIALVKQLKDNPQAAKSVEESYGKDYALELQQADPAKLGADAEKLYAELTEKYLPDLKPASIAILCQQLYYTHDSEMLLRALYTRDKRDEVRGVACLALAQVLMRHADNLASTDAKTAAKMRIESENLLEEAAGKYADVQTAFDGSVGRKSRSELFDLRYLSVGKAAPEIQGTDQDGKPFKLSDYKGKVVLLDFWSEF